MYDTYTQPSTISLCDSSRFYCQQGTVMFEQYDDPVTGWAYNCTADAVRETCGTDTVTRCVSFFPCFYVIPFSCCTCMDSRLTHGTGQCFPFWGLGASDSNPLNH